MSEQRLKDLIEALPGAVYTTDFKAKDCGYHLIMWQQLIVTSEIY
ncbi:hypothetical protein [Rhizobium mongolense]|nr:hypothetical protein [Rhizobium mongolense]